MGGNAFDKPGPNGEPAIATTRLSSATYRQLKERHMNILAQHFLTIHCPDEAPEKTSHGDIDVLVEGPRDRASAADLARVLHATRYITNGITTNFAIPLADPANNRDSAAAYYQLDTHLCTSPDQLRYLAFHQSNSDLSQLLNAILRPHHLLFTDTGLHVRIVQGESRNRKESRVFLSDSPADICPFLGLDWHRFEAGPFRTIDELFKWVTACRFFEKKVVMLKAETANDRRRMKLRPLFRRFVEEYIPSLPDSEGREWSRDEVLYAALQAFGKEAEYAAKVTSIERVELESIAGQRLIKLLDGEGLSVANLNLVVRAVKRWTRYDDEDGLSVRETAEMDPAHQIWLGSLLDDEKQAMKDDIVIWVKDHYAELKTLERHRVKEAKAERQKSGSSDDESVKLE